MAAFTALLAITAVTTAIQAAGQVKAGNAAKKAGALQQEAAESEAQLQEYNAAQADLQARDAELRGQSDEQLFRQQISQTIGAQRAGIAAQGADVNFGSALEVQQDSQRLGEQDVMTIRNNAAREALGYKVAAENDRRAAGITRKGGAAAYAAGKQAQSASRWAAGGSIATAGAGLLQAKYGFGTRRYGTQPQAVG